MVSTTKRGRPKERRFADFVATLNVASKPRSVVSVRGIARLLNIDEERAKEMLEQISIGAENSTSNGFLQLASNDDGSEYLNFSDKKNAAIKPVRLTPSQAETCIKAFRHLGMPSDDSLYTKTAEAFFPVDSDEKMPASEQNAQSRVQVSKDAYKVLKTCAEAKAKADRISLESADITSPSVSFTYIGSNDEMGRSLKKVVPLALYTKENEWVVKGYDCYTKSIKDYFVSQISDCRISEDTVRVPTGANEIPQSGTVTFTCDKSVVPNVLSWPKTHFEEEFSDGRVVISADFYRGDWLAKHALALGNSISFENEDIKTEMQRIASNNLKKAASSKIKKLR